MIKSKYLWIAIVLVGIVPMLFLDILQHSFDWQKEVRSEIISVAYENFSNSQKKEILDRLFERNYTLTTLIIIKGIGGAIALIAAFYCFRLFKRRSKLPVNKAIIFMSLSSIVLFLLIKIFVINEIIRNDKVRFLSFSPGGDSFKNFYKKNFEGKIVYVDFWGTTCGPCLQEFRDFTVSLKNKYKSRKDLAYFYISEGNRYLWKGQIRKYNVEGDHIFLGFDDYEMLFRQLTLDTSQIFIPRYVVIDKRGEVVVTNAKQPHDGQALFDQLDLYLNK